MICDRRKYSAVIPDRERRTDFHRVLRSVYFLQCFGLFKEMNSSLVAIVSDQVLGLFQAQRHNAQLVSTYHGLGTFAGCLLSLSDILQTTSE